MTPELAAASASASGVAAGTCYSVYLPDDGSSNVDGDNDGKATETVVLIHGVGMNQSVWAPQLAALTSRYRVVAYDMLGHGGSTLPSAQPSLDEYAAQLAHLLDALQLRSAHVVGHSMGALVALEFALNYPTRTLSVVALNAVYDRSPEQRAAVLNRAATLDASSTVAGVDATLARWFGSPVPGHLTDAACAVRGLLTSVDPVGYARTYQLFASSDDAHVGRLAQLAVPALFLTGECDPNSSPQMSRAMAAVAPLGRAEVIANERHMMNVTEPALVNERLLAFLSDAPRAAQEAAR